MKTGLNLRFAVRIILYTLCVLGVYFLLYGEEIGEKGNLIVLIVLLLMGYFRAWKWLKRNSAGGNGQDEEKNN